MFPMWKPVRSGSIGSMAQEPLLKSTLLMTRTAVLTIAFLELVIVSIHIIIGFNWPKHSLKHHKTVLKLTRAVIFCLNCLGFPKFMFLLSHMTYVFTFLLEKGKSTHLTSWLNCLVWLSEEKPTWKTHWSKRCVSLALGCGGSAFICE